MKYEILKGSEKDFEGYEERITHIYTTPFGRGISNGEVSGLRGYEVAVRRPITEPDVIQQLTTEWSGEGLPPVGVECEWLDNRGIYIPVKVVYSSEYSLVIQVKSSLDEKVDIPLDPIMNSDKCKFRPIRSAEDVARDSEVNDMAQIIEYRTGCSPKPLAGWLYDAGYRKVE